MRIGDFGLSVAMAHAHHGHAHTHTHGHGKEHTDAGAQLLVEHVEQPADARGTRSPRPHWERTVGVGSPLYGASEQMHAASMIATHAAANGLHARPLRGGQAPPAPSAATTFTPQYDEKADVFSLGVILVELLHQFSSDSERYRVLLRARKGLFTISETFTEAAAALAQRLLHANPASRPTAAEAAADPWVQQMKNLSDKAHL